MKSFHSCFYKNIFEFFSPVFFRFLSLSSFHTIAIESPSNFNRFLLFRYIHNFFNKHKIHPINNKMETVKKAFCITNRINTINFMFTKFDLFSFWIKIIQSFIFQLKINEMATWTQIFIVWFLQTSTWDFRCTDKSAISILKACRIIKSLHPKSLNSKISAHFYLFQLKRKIHQLAKWIYFHMEHF